MRQGSTSTVKICCALQIARNSGYDGSPPVEVSLVSVEMSLRLVLLLAAPLLWRPTILEHPSEDAVDVPQLTFQIECALDLRARHAARDLIIFQNQVTKI